MPKDVLRDDFVPNFESLVPMEGIVEEAEEVADERRRCLPECMMTEYAMSLQSLPYDTKPYQEHFRSYPNNLSKDVIGMLENPQ